MRGINKIKADFILLIPRLFIFLHLMKVLIVSTSELQGGAAIAARRLMDALNHTGVEARMLVRDRQTADERVGQVHAGLWRKAWERLCILLANRLRMRGMWKLSIANTGVDITGRPEFLWADVIHLHWTCQGFLSLGDLQSIIQSGKRVVWTMHDQWPFTGVCHLLQGCQGFTLGCRDCPQMRGSLPHRIFRRKQETYALGPVTFVGCSQWITGLALRSPLTAGHRVVSIPNPVPQEIFRPASQAQARQALSLPPGQKLILFAACRVKDTLKGFQYLQQALRQFSSSEGVALLVVGRNSDIVSPLPTYKFPFVGDPRQMARLYAAADVFVTGSLTENLPNTIAEAMSCGTPCCAFSVGGIPEMIEHRVNGYLARPGDADDLAAGIRFCLAGRLRQAAASSAARAYSEQAVASRYVSEAYGGQEGGAPSLRFTVATVTYNAASTLPATLASVAGQDYPLVEHLIIDGASTDETPALLQRYGEENAARQDAHTVSILSEPDRGLYDAMNKAISRAKGDYIVFLNAGDRLHSSHTLTLLARQLRHWPGQLPAVLYGQTDLVDAGGRFLRHRRLQAPARLTWRSFLGGMLVCHQSFYVRTDLARRQAYDLRYRFSSDFDWCIRIMKQAQAGGLVLHNSHLVLTDYLSEGLTTRNHRRSLLERFRIMTRHYGWVSTIAMHMWFTLRSVIKR